MFAPPAVAGDLVFIGSCAGTFYALDARSGDVRWSYDVRRDGEQTSFHGNVLFDAQNAIFGTDHSCAAEGIGHVYAVNGATGAIIWKYRSASGVGSNLVRTRNSVCFGTVGGEWGCVDRNNGTLLWKISLLTEQKACELPVWAATDGQRLFIVDRDGAVSALNAGDGKRLWKRRLAARATTSPVVVGGILYVGAADERVYALGTSTGSLHHSVAVPGRPVGRPTAARDALLFLTERSVRRKGGIVCLDRRGKRIKWTVQHERTFASEQPHAWGELIVVGDCAGVVRAVASTDGSPRWEMKVAGCVRSIGSSNGQLFIGAQEGTVYSAVPE